MKRILLPFLLVALAALVCAQDRTAGYFQKIPAIPRDSCSITRAQAESFEAQVSLLADQLTAEIRTLDRKADEAMKGNEKTAKETALRNLSQQYGMSEQDIARLKDAKNLSPADKQALAGRMMIQQTGLSPDEIKNLSGMSDAERKAFAAGYGYGASRAAAAPDARQTARADKAKAGFDLLNEQQAVMAKISASSKKIANAYSAVENDPEGAKMLERISAWHNKLMSLSGVDYGQGPQMDSLAALIKNEQIRYCERLTPKYRAALRLHYASLRASLPDYRRLGEITSELVLAQTGTTPPPESIESGCLKAVEEYLAKLKNAFAYTLYYPERR